MSSTSLESCTQPANATRRAFALGGALFLYLVTLKMWLAYVYAMVRGVPVLDGMSGWVWPLIPGGDFAFCVAMAVGFATIFAIGDRTGRWGRRFAEGIALGGFFAVAIFSCFSTKINQIYGWPLDIHHMRAGGNLGQLGGSIWAYVDAASTLMVALGLAEPWVFGRPILAGLRRVRWAGDARGWVVALALAAVVGGAWTRVFEGHYTYGLKKNAVLHFVQYYEGSPTPINAPARLTALSGSAAADPAMRRAASLIDNKPMPRDFAKPVIPGDMNVVMILLESTSNQFIDPRTTPNLDALMRHGLRFEAHFTTFTETYKAVYALFYSDYLTDLGGHPAELYGRPLPQRSLAEVFADAGYETGFFHSGYADYANLRYFFKDKGMRTIVGALEMKDQAAGRGWMWGVYEELTVGRLTDWIAARKDKRFFAVYSTMFPHHPYHCPIDERPFDEGTWEGKYRNSLHYVDKNVGTLLETLDLLGQRDKTLIVFMGDHGETVSTFPVGHGLAMTLDEIRVPMVYSNPVMFPAPEVSRIPTNHLDFAPTLAAMVGLPADRGWLGRNLLADSIEPRLLFVQVDQARIRGVIDGDWVFKVDDKGGRAGLYSRSEGGLTALGEDDPRRGWVGAYRALADTFADWAVWRHYERALGTGGNVPQRTQRAQR